MEVHAMFRSLLLFTLLAAFVPSAWAVDARDSRFALHRVAVPGPTPTAWCSSGPNAADTPCSAYNTSAPLGYSLVYIVIGMAPPVGVNGASFGIDYDGREGTGIDPRYVTFDFCFDGLVLAKEGEFGDFPAPRGAARFTSLTCQQTQVGGAGVHAIVGALQLYAYSQDTLRLTPHNNLTVGSPELTVSTCDGTTTDLADIYPPAMLPSLLGRIDFGSGSGYMPCGVVPAVPSTWGRMKSLFTN
jgi:hypothetical protein